MDNLLVVTFTVLAAQEMKDRLIKNLKNEILNCAEHEKERILTIIEKIKTAQNDLMTSAQKIGEALYKDQTAAGTTTDSANAQSSADDDVVDAHVVDDDEKKDE